ncbi:MAG: transporter substrate-binding domain-containing protein [Clostridia bacterium]|nr:transporter substrate-binding domain-containing protein [Clostridia bacterium]
MKKVIQMIALALILALVTLSVGVAAEPFRVGMECDYAPFNWTQADPSDMAVPIENGRYADGYDVQIARLIAEGLGRELVIVRIDWDGLPLAVMSGTIDAIIAGMSATPERALTIDFTELYYESDLVVVVRKDSPYADAQTLADLEGARITGQLNTTHYDVVDQIPGVNKQTAMDGFPVMVVALNAGAIDGYVSERPGAVSAAVANPGLSYVSFAEGQGFDVPPERIAVGLRQGSDLLEAINAVLATLDEEARERTMEGAVSRQPLSE